MKKKIALLGLCLLLITGCGSKVPTLSNGEEAVVTFKKGNDISVDSFYKQIKDTLGLETLINMIDKQILETVYKDDLEDAKESAESSISSIEAQYGDQTDSAIQYYTGYATAAAYKDYLYLAYLQNLAVTDYAKEQITDKQIKKYYDSDIVGDIKVSHILITPAVTDKMSEDEKKEAEEVAKKEAEEIIKTLKSTKKADIATKFAELAKEHSDDEATAEDGGNMGYINKATMDATKYGDFADKAYALKDGAYTAEVITSSYGYHVVLRVESKEKAKLDTVRDSIIETLAQKLIKDDATTSINALRDLREEYGFEIQDSELKKQYQNYIQNLLAKATESNSSSES